MIAPSLVRWLGARRRGAGGPVGKAAKVGERWQYVLANCGEFAAIRFKDWLAIDGKI